MEGIAGAQSKGWVVQQCSRLAEPLTIHRPQLHASLQELLQPFSGRRAGPGGQSVVALLDPQGAVGLGDQPVAADQGLAAGFEPLQGRFAVGLRGEQGHHHTGVKVDHVATSAQCCGTPPSPVA
jgi:hypothetical protein